MTSNIRNTFAHPLPERIFVDASHTCASGKNSGIERVVRSLLAECGHWCEADGLPVPQSVTHHAGQFFCVENQVEKQFMHVASLEANVRSKLPNWYLGLAQRLCKSLTSPRLRKWLLPEAGHLGLFTFQRLKICFCCQTLTGQGAAFGPPPQRHASKVRPLRR